MIVDFRLLRVPLALSILLCAIAALATEIREFDIKTLERLGNELTRVSLTPDRGATTPERKRAKQTAIAALKGRLFNIHYDYVVLDDPNGSGFLVYALASTGKPNEFVLAGHFRVTVSADGAKAERVDALSRSLAIQRGGEGLAVGSHLVGMYMVQIVVVNLWRRSSTPATWRECRFPWQRCHMAGFMRWRTEKSWILANQPGENEFRSNARFNSSPLPFSSVSMPEL